MQEKKNDPQHIWLIYLIKFTLLLFRIFVADKFGFKLLQIIN